MDYKVCWKCKGLVSNSKLTQNEIDTHMRQCPGGRGSSIESTIFDYYVCEKADFFALVDIKKSLNKDVCIRLKNQVSTSTETDVPGNVIKSLLKLSISKDLEILKQATLLNIMPDNNLNETASRGEQASAPPKVPLQNFSAFSNKNVSCSSTNLDRSQEKETILNIMTDDEKVKLSKECNTVKKGNFEELICKLCEFQSKSNKIMIRHLQTHNNGQAFVCNDCNFSTLTRSKWNLHRCKHNKGNSMCHHCPERFQSQRRLDFHLASVHSEKINHSGKSSSKQLHCDCCDYVGRDVASLKEHKRKHTGESLTCPLDDCDFKTLYKRSLQKHLQQKHSKEKNQICEVCGFQTRHVASLKKHMLIHQNSKQYRCAECSYSSYSPSEVLLHVQRKHLKQKNRSCPKCPFQTAYVMAMKKHLTRHERLEADEARGKKSVKSRNVKIYSCPVCADVFNSMNKAKEHVHRYHGTAGFQIMSDITKKSSSLEGKKSKDPHAFGDKNMNFDNLLDMDITNDVLDMASNILNTEVARKDNYATNNIDMSLPVGSMCQNVFDDNSDVKSSVSRKGGNPMLSATSDALADLESSLLEDSLFNLMSDLPRPPTLNRCQSASTLMFASFTQPMVDRPLTPDFFTDSPAQSFFQNFSSRSMDQDNFPVSSLNQPFQISTGFPSQMDLTATSSKTNKPLSPVLPSFTCFPTHHSTSQSSPIPSSSVDTDTAMSECLL